jgi:hypothetical protein
MSEPMSTAAEKAIAVLSDWEGFDTWWSNLDGRLQTALIKEINEKTTTPTKPKFIVNEIVKYQENGNWCYGTIVEIDYSDNPHAPVYKVRSVNDANVVRTIAEHLLIPYQKGIKTLPPQTNTAKYKTGDQVLVRFELGDVHEDGDYFYYEAYVLHDNPPVKSSIAWDLELEVPEFWIESKTEMKEPTKPGTVVVVGGDSWVLLGDESEEWYNAVSDENNTWTELLKLGTPKVVWEPEN